MIMQSFIWLDNATYYVTISHLDKFGVNFNFSIASPNKVLQIQLEIKLFKVKFTHYKV